MQRKFLQVNLTGELFCSSRLEQTASTFESTRMLKFSETTEGFKQTALLEPTRADRCDIRVGSNVEQAFFIKPYGRPNGVFNTSKS